MYGGAWWAAVHGVRKSRRRLSDFTFTFHFHALEKEMATHSSVLAWRIPGTGEPGGLLSLGSHRVGHDWSDLAKPTMGKGTHNWPSCWPVCRHCLPRIFSYILCCLIFHSALGRPRGLVRGGRREEGSGWGTHVYLWRIHFDIWQN